MHSVNLAQEVFSSTEAFIGKIWGLTRNICIYRLHRKYLVHGNTKRMEYVWNNPRKAQTSLWLLVLD